jgi:hypothetical protein
LMVFFYECITRVTIQLYFAIYATNDLLAT